MKKIHLNKELADNGTRNLPTIPVSLSIMDMISIYNLCLETVQEYPEMVGYKDICKRFAEIIKVHNTPTPKTPTEPATLDGFTPGEWNNNLHDGNVYDSGGLLVANCYSSLRGMLTVKANAALIAQAPRLYRENQELREQNRVLLEALQDLITECEFSVPDTMMIPIRDAKAAIQSATK